MIAPATMMTSPAGRLWVMTSMEASQWATECGVEARHKDHVVHVSHPYANRTTPATVPSRRRRRAGTILRSSARPKSKASSTHRPSASHKRSLPRDRSCGTAPIVLRYRDTELCIHASTPYRATTE